MGMILIQGERKFYIFFFESLQLLFFFRPVVAKKKMQFRWRGTIFWYEAEKFRCGRTNQIKTKKELSPQLSKFSFKKHTQTHTKN